MVEGAPLLRAYGSKAHRGFESLPLRHTAYKFSTFSLRLLSQRQRGGSSPRYRKGGSTKSPKAILDDAHASPEGRGPKARVNPSLSASRPINSRRFRSDYCGSDEAGITPVRAAPKGRGAERRVIPPSPPQKNPCKSRILWKNIPAIAIVRSTLSATRPPRDSKKGVGCRVNDRADDAHPGSADAYVRVARVHERESAVPDPSSHLDGSAGDANRGYASVRVPRANDDAGARGFP